MSKKKAWPFAATVVAKGQVGKLQNLEVLDKELQDGRRLLIARNAGSRRIEALPTISCSSIAVRYGKPDFLRDSKLSGDKLPIICWLR